MTRQVKVKDLLIGGSSPVSVQSMTSLPIDNVEGTVAQIEALQRRGAHLVRLALLTVDSAGYLEQILSRV
ncbi:MAG: flavodoxin-dependent (E)-4-hydroxy-3-methylbut-2-enyl-diphosphate synthase, partial [Spirochaetota bacterium]